MRYASNKTTTPVEPPSPLPQHSSSSSQVSRRTPPHQSVLHGMAFSSFSRMHSDQTMTPPPPVLVRTDSRGKPRLQPQVPQNASTGSSGLAVGSPPCYYSPPTMSDAELLTSITKRRTANAASGGDKGVGTCRTAPALAKAALFLSAASATPAMPPPPPSTRAAHVQRLANNKSAKTPRGISSQDVPQRPRERRQHQPFISKGQGNIKVHSSPAERVSRDEASGQNYTAAVSIPVKKDKTTLPSIRTRKDIGTVCANKRPETSPSSSFAAVTIPPKDLAKAPRELPQQPHTRRQVKVANEHKRRLPGQSKKQFSTLQVQHKHNQGGIAKKKATRTKHQQRPLPRKPNERSSQGARTMELDKEETEPPSKGRMRAVYSPKEDKEGGGEEKSSPIRATGMLLRPPPPQPAKKQREEESSDDDDDSCGVDTLSSVPPNAMMVDHAYTDYSVVTEEELEQMDSAAPQKFHKFADNDFPRDNKEDVVGTDKADEKSSAMDGLNSTSSVGTRQQQQAAKKHESSKLEKERSVKLGLLKKMLDRNGPTRKNSGGVVQPFPVKLMEVLDRGDMDDIISWMPHGRSFLVKQPKIFVSNVLPRFFKQSKFMSFTRQLNLWGYKRITRGTDQGAYYHELFLRGRPRLSMRMKRQKIKGTGIKLTPNPDQEPDFYEMSKRRPLPPVRRDPNELKPLPPLPPTVPKPSGEPEAGEPTTADLVTSSMEPIDAVADNSTPRRASAPTIRTTPKNHTPVPARRSLPPTVGSTRGSRPNPSPFLDGRPHQDSLDRFGSPFSSSPAARGLLRPDSGPPCGSSRPHVAFPHNNWRRKILVAGGDHQQRQQQHHQAARRPLLESPLQRARRAHQQAQRTAAEHNIPFQRAQLQAHMRQEWEAAVNAQTALYQFGALPPPAPNGEPLISPSANTAIADLHRRLMAAARALEDPVHHHHQQAQQLQWLAPLLGHLPNIGMSSTAVVPASHPTIVSALGGTANGLDSAITRLVGNALTTAGSTIAAVPNALQQQQNPPQRQYSPMQQHRQQPLLDRLASRGGGDDATAGMSLPSPSHHNRF